MKTKALILPVLTTAAIAAAGCGGSTIDHSNTVRANVRSAVQQSVSQDVGFNLDPNSVSSIKQIAVHRNGNTYTGSARVVLWAFSKAGIASYAYEARWHNGHVRVQLAKPRVHADPALTHKVEQGLKANSVQTLQ